MTNREWLNSLSDIDFTNWLEDFAESYTTFWIMPFDKCDFSHRNDDKTIQLHWLGSEHRDEIGF